MPSRWGGRAEGSEGYLPLETQLEQQAAHYGYTLQQVQALVCLPAFGYTNSHRPQLKLLKEYLPGAVQQHNKKAATANKVSLIKVFLFPAHLLVHHWFFQFTVRCPSCLLAGHIFPGAALNIALSALQCLGALIDLSQD